MNSRTLNGRHHVIRSFRTSRVAWLAFVGLVRPGRPLPTYLESVEIDTTLDKWGDDDFDLMIDEGRRQYDGQVSSRSRAGATSLSQREVIHAHGQLGSTYVSTRVMGTMLFLPTFEA